MMTGVSSPVHVDAQIVSWDLLPTLGARPKIGRGFSQEEEKPGTRVVLISHALWMAQFAGDTAIVGRTVSLSGQLFTILGVMPASFRFPMSSPQNDMWTTLAVDEDSPDPLTTKRGMHFLNAIGRLKAGVAVAQANQDLSTIAAILAKQYPATNTHNDSAKARTELTALLGRHANSTDDCVGRRGAGAANCMWQRCQPVAGANARAATRDRYAHGVGRGPQPDHPSIAGGELCVEHRRWVCRVLPGLCLHASYVVTYRRHHSARIGCRSGPAHSGICHCYLMCGGTDIRDRPPRRSPHRRPNR